MSVYTGFPLIETTIDGVVTPLGTDGQVLRMNGTTPEFGSVVPTGNAFDIVQLNSSGSSLNTNANAIRALYLGSSVPTLTGTRSFAIGTKGTVSVGAEQSGVIGCGSGTCSLSGGATIALASPGSITTNGSGIVVGAVVGPVNVAASSVAVFAMGAFPSGLSMTGNASFAASSDSQNLAITLSGTRTSLLSCNNGGAGGINISGDGASCISYNNTGGPALISGVNAMVLGSVGNCQISGEDSLAIGCEGNTTITHNNSVCIGTNTQTSNADNEVYMDNLEVNGAAITSDARTKKGLRDATAEEKTNMCSRFCSLNSKRYRYKKEADIADERFGFDADEVEAIYPGVVKSTFVRHYRCKRDNVQSKWICEKWPVDELGEFSQDDVVQDPSTDDVNSGVLYRKMKRNTKSIDMMALLTVTVEMCQEQQKLIDDLQTRMATVESLQNI